MNSSRLGCLTSTGIIATILTGLIIAGVILTQGGVLFSPGALNAQSGSPLGGMTSHAALSGQCKACHSAPWESAAMADRCVACHTDVAMQRQDAATLHGVLLQSAPGIACRACHPEHNGPDAPLTVLDESLFPHQSLGYSLEGHLRKTDGTSFGCRDCHRSNFTSFDQAICVTCHQQINASYMQEHIQTFGADCLACHDGVDTYGSNFDHGRFIFPLVGKHAAVLCSQCHMDARSIADLQAAPQDCFSCHLQDDPHEGRFGVNCGVCHTPNGWIPAEFDHTLASFQLEGKHAEVACEACHVNNIFKSTPTDCYSCHSQDDQHQGQFGRDCGLCHTPAGWLPAIFDHSLAAFPLTGKHIEVACEACHVNNIFKGTPIDCYSCHSQNDPHQGQFGRECGACHTTSDWLPATFDHSKSTFPLTGAHVNVACAQCHVNNVFKGTPTDCNSCHSRDDIHQGRFGTSCGSCHSTSGWLPATFDHSKSAFPLTGAHTVLACTQCHVNNVFAGTPTICSACHSDPFYHVGLFGLNCASCHITSNWYATYTGSHPVITNEGGSGVNHGGTSCRTCHPSSLSTYTCLACHDSNNPGGGGGGDD